MGQYDGLPREWTQVHRASRVATMVRAVVPGGAMERLRRLASGSFLFLHTRAVDGVGVDRAELVGVPLA